MQRLAGIDAELFGEQLTQLAVGGQCVGLTARSVERHHQLAPEGFAQGVRLDQRLDLAGDLTVAAQGEIGVDPPLERGQPEVLQPGDVRLAEGPEVHPVEDRAPPQSQGLRHPVGHGSWGFPQTGGGGQALELHRVEFPRGSSTT